MKRLREAPFRFCFCVFLISLSFHVTEGLAVETTPYQTIDRALSYIVEHQNPDGGWPLIPGGESDIEETAFAIQALILTERWGTGSSIVRRGVVYLTTHQQADGSWNGNTAHTVFALIALHRAETDPDARFKGLQWLKTAQNNDGSWGREMNQPGNTLYTAAVLAGLSQLGFNQSFSAVPKAAEWLVNHMNADGGWSIERGGPSDVMVTSWVLQGISLVYDIDEQLAWLKRKQNDDGGFGRWEGQPSDPEVTAYAIMALVAGEDPLNTDQVAIAYLRRIQQEDGSFVSATPIELKEPKANLQTTSFVLWAIYAKEIKIAK